MNVENKIREFLAKSREVGTLSEELQELDEAQALAPNVKPGDSSNPTQGSSNANPEMQDLSGTGNKEGGLTSEVGKAAASKISKDGTLPSGNGAKEAPSNFENEDTPEKVVNMSGSKGNVHQEEVEAEAEEVIAEDEASEVEYAIAEEEVSSEEVIEEEETLFGSDIQGLFESEENLSEEFKVKAAGIFEAVVTARIANEMEAIEADLREEVQGQQETFKEELVEKLDSFLSYVAENWMKENELAIERGLRSEITEDFISGMKTLFAEHYIEVPEEKYDVLGEMQDKIESLESKLNESLEEKIEIVAEKVALQRKAIISEASVDLTLTEAEKFAKLVEDIDFGSEDIFAEKVAVVKENYFPKQGQQSISEDKLEDTVDGDYAIENSNISRYAQAISKSAKF